MFLFGNSSPDGTTREGNLGEEYAGVPTIRAKRLARLQLGTLAAALSAEPKVLDKSQRQLIFESNWQKTYYCAIDLLLTYHDLLLTYQQNISLICVSIARRWTSMRLNSTIRFILVSARI